MCRLPSQEPEEIHGVLFQADAEEELVRDRIGEEVFPLPARKSEKLTGIFRRERQVKEAALDRRSPCAFLSHKGKRFR